MDVPSDRTDSQQVSLRRGEARLKGLNAANAEFRPNDIARSSQPMVESTDAFAESTEQHGRESDQNVA